MPALFLFVQSIRAWIVDALVGFWIGLWTWFLGILDGVCNDLWDAFYGLLPSWLITFVNGLPGKLASLIAALESWMPSGMQWDDIFWILPVLPCAVIWGTGFTFCGVVRLIRWGKSCIPTVGD